MRLKRGRRASLALTLNFVALALAFSAVTTSYWCEGTRKWPTLLHRAAAQDQTVVLHPLQQLQRQRLAPGAVHFETGEEKFLLRKFHHRDLLQLRTGRRHERFSFVFCVSTGFDCRDFSEIAPEHERGVLWLCIVAESCYLSLLFTGGLLMTLEQCPCFSLINKLKLSAFAALCTAASGLCGMVAHMMFTTVFQLAVAMGPEDWRPKTWDYSWSYILEEELGRYSAGSGVGIFRDLYGICGHGSERYTKTIVEFKYKRRNIAKSLVLKQKLLELDLPQDVWGGYGYDPCDPEVTFDPSDPEATFDSCDAEENFCDPEASFDPCDAEVVFDPCDPEETFDSCDPEATFDLHLNGHKPSTGSAFELQVEDSRENTVDHYGLFLVL
ncbi:hypothetical protein WMY93_001712 [Mugilogobius chulae]|uniref:Germ cell-specific gene 1-like protein n=1 Tax=Mugilogobius chulae TaxID=88201 RepID=A0AAW0PXI5_9GOBI